ncbi:phasin family protein [Halomonas sp. 18H]|uniref:phasin family protein n=1 Tax=Halomonas almeriensis TaxID=308163 RepID=UPI00222F7A86|nr:MULTISPECIES: phasin family protein [Halomonas]MCW4151159.1 phasin family protein [Halomonas sp. 18H]MDN3553039.1 phasin family protein [Halomonas almeriensis]
MRDYNTQQFTEQFESMFFGPARAYASLSVDFTEKMLRAQMDASQAYTETGIAQLRSLLNVKDAEGLRNYMEGQQKVAKDLTERFKGDAEKVVSMQQDFVQESQKLTDANVKQASETVEKATRKA